ncbi:MAG: hypothetical protein ACK4UT_07910, partial [Moraxellaceae bacterium]
MPVRILSFLLILLAAGAARADALGAWRSAYQCALNQHEMLTDYHLHASDPKDRQLLAGLQRSRKTAQDCARQVAETLNGLGQARFSTDIANHERQIARTLAYNLETIARKGVPENAVVAEMVQHTLDLLSRLTGAANELAASGAAKPVAEARQARELALLMEYANQRYIERTTQLYQRDDSAETTIDELANNFGKGLAALRASKRLTDAQRRKLDAVLTRFRFINGSLLNYNDKTVPFTVNRHAHG